MAISQKAKKTKIKLSDKKKKDYSSERKVNVTHTLILLWASLLCFIVNTVTVAFTQNISNSNNGFLIISFTIIDCIAFPLLACWLVERHRLIEERAEDPKKERKGLFFKLLCLAVLCEIPFNAIKGESPIYLGSQNVLFTLAVSSPLLTVMNKTFKFKRLSQDENKQKKYNIEVKFIILAAVVFATALANFDNGGEGVALIVLLDIARKKKRRALYQFLAFALFVAASGEIVMAFAFIALIIIYILQILKKDPVKNERKFRALETTGILIYPVQLAALMILKIMARANLMPL